MFNIGDELIIYKTCSIRDYTKGIWRSDSEYLHNICSYVGKYVITKINKRSYSVKALEKGEHHEKNLKWKANYIGGGQGTEYIPEKLDDFKIATIEEYPKLKKQAMLQELLHSYEKGFCGDYRMKIYDEEVEKKEENLQLAQKLLDSAINKRDKVKRDHEESIGKFPEIWNKIKETM